MIEQPIWKPGAARVADANITHFRRACTARWQVELDDYQALHRFSIEHADQFWTSFWDYARIRGDRGSNRVVAEADEFYNRRYFPDATLNFADNLLMRGDDQPALISQFEEMSGACWSWRQLKDTVTRLAASLHAYGIRQGDVVAAIAANRAETVIAMLATSAIGAIWTSCSPDFGVQGILDRFGQTRPKFLFASRSYTYQGKCYLLGEKLCAISRALPTIEQIVLFDAHISDADKAHDQDQMPAGSMGWDEALAAGSVPEDAPVFRPLPFDHPLYIMYSSGTTGKPKCIIHSAGGVLLRQRAEQLLNCNVKAGDRLFFFTTCGWMMWNWLVAGLASEATLLLYDGSPLHPDPGMLFRFAEQTGMTQFGTSARFIDALCKSGYQPAKHHDLSSLQAIFSTGSPLSAEGFDYVYREISQDVHLASVSGGTDIMGCFVGGDPTGPVYRGRIQCAMLGMDAQIYSETGERLFGKKGELVCASPFSSMPIGFWDDADGARYFDAYFARFPGIWHHGDFAEQAEDGSFVIVGRSDATLNPGGVRIGTAELYRQIERFGEIEEAVVIAQEWEGDSRIVLFVRMREGRLDEVLIQRIKARIRSECSPRHVPQKIIAVADIPRTRSGKITELAVREIVHGRPVKNREALANPESLAFFADLEALQ
ncbi:MAG: acetoacetate--CoA ligase [Pseudomonadota bacterium]